MVEPIVALDFTNIEEAERIIDILAQEVNIYKIGTTLFFSAGKEAILMVNRKGKKVFLDLKLHDIPYVVDKVCEEVAKLGVYMCTAHILGGRDMLTSILERFKLAKSSFGSKPLLIGVTLLSSHSILWPKELGIDLDSSSLVMNLVELAKEVGLDGVVVAPQDAASVRRRFGKDLLLISPGISTSSHPSLREHKRGAKLEEVASWVDYIVVGRPIIAAKDPIGAIREIKYILSQ